MNRQVKSPSPERSLEQTLAQWRHWRCEPPLPGAPHLERKLSGGLSNHNFLVSAAAQQWVVRIDGVNPLHHGLNRQVEYRTLQMAAQAGIAPSPCYFNPELGALVYRYLPADEEQSLAPAELARLCRAIHSLPPRRQRLDLEARARRYLGLIERAGKNLPANALVEAVGSITSLCQDGAQVLCHNDLLPANLLRSNGCLMALDWEYSAMGNPWFDLAVAGDGQGYGSRDFSHFLEAYLGHTPGEQESMQLKRHQVIYRYIEMLWHLAEADPAQAEEVLASGSRQVSIQLDGLFNC